MKGVYLNGVIHPKNEAVYKYTDTTKEGILQERLQLKTKDNFVEITSVKDNARYSKQVSNKQKKVYLPQEPV